MAGQELKLIQRDICCNSGKHKACGSSREDRLVCVCVVHVCGAQKDFPGSDA